MAFDGSKFETKIAPVEQADPVGKILLDAADLIEKHGWAQGAFGNEERGFCTLGAIMKAGGLSSALVSMSLYHPVAEAEIRLMKILHRYDVAGWNDDFQRSSHEVVRTLRLAAKASG